MNLYLTGKYQDCSYTNDDDQIVYAVETPFGFFSTTSTIKRAIYDGQVDARTGRGSYRLITIAEIELNSFSSSLIRFDGGREYETSEFFEGIGWNKDLGFTGADGLQYKWRLSERTLALVRRDAAKTPIARFRNRSFGIIGRESHPPFLEIYPDGMHMVDLIIITYIFAQHKDDSRRNSRNSMNNANRTNTTSVGF